jgi:bis(5'-nucleosidyl)-tetraphosphatase
MNIPARDNSVRAPGPSSRQQSSVTPLKDGQNKTEEVKKQIVAGFIVFRRTEEGTKYLLLYRRGGYWNFPKGHFEQGENAMDTALRETFEETGLKKEELKIIPGFKTLVRFHFKAGNMTVHDTVILYLAETKQAHIVLSPREHSGFAWFLYPDALKILGRYMGTKRALMEANNFLKAKNNPRRPNNFDNRQRFNQNQRPGRSN